NRTRAIAWQRCLTWRVLGYRCHSPAPDGRNSRRQVRRQAASRLYESIVRHAAAERGYFPSLLPEFVLIALARKLPGRKTRRNIRRGRSTQLLESASRSRASRIRPVHPLLRETPTAQHARRGTSKQSRSAAPRPVLCAAKEFSVRLQHSGRI